MLVCARQGKSVRVHSDDVRVVVKTMRPGTSVPAAQVFDKKAPDSMFSHDVEVVVVVPS